MTGIHQYNITEMVPNVIYLCCVDQVREIGGYLLS